MGADAWRMAGVLTFDSNCQVKEKVTCRKIQQHLQEGSFHTVLSCSSVSQETATTILPCATSEWLRSHVGAQEKDSVCDI